MENHETFHGYSYLFDGWQTGGKTDGQTDRWTYRIVSKNKDLKEKWKCKEKKINWLLIYN